MTAGYGQRRSGADFCPVCQNHSVAVHYCEGCDDYVCGGCLIVETPTRAGQVCVPCLTTARLDVGHGPGVPPPRPR